MKVCQITEEVLEIYKPYIPEEYHDVCRIRDRIGLGIYDENGAYGAAVLEVKDGLAEILSISYTDSLAEGDCEKLITEVILQQKNWEIGRIMYVIESEANALDSYDYMMLDLGYFPSKGQVTRYCADLKTIVKTQGGSVNIFRRKLDSNSVPVDRGDKLPANLIGQHNQLFGENAYRTQEYNPELCFFYMQNGTPIAGVYAKENQQGELVLSWMNQKNQPPVVILKMIFAVLVNAAEMYPPNTSVAVYPFADTVRQIVVKFGMRADVDHTRITRIYTMYVEEGK